MKIKSIAAICKKRKVIQIYTKRHGSSVIQYIGDGIAAYPLDNMPELDTKSVMTIFDIPEKQQEDWYVAEKDIPEGANFGDADFGEKMLETQSIQIIWSDATLKPLKSRHGMILIDKKYLAPVMDSAELMEFYERVTPDGRNYVAIKVGLMLQAVIFPVTTNETLIDGLWSVTKGISEQVECQKMRTKSIGEETMQINIETGEVLEKGE